LKFYIPGIISLILVFSSSAFPAGVQVELDFSKNASLPSSQGFTYFSDLATAESSVFSVSGGLLHMNTLGTHAVALYALPNGFDASSNLTLEIRAQVFPGTTSGR
jgi:hypothetical protein